eukprot:EC685176.1.p1 GENE.EC685176.1~~EC685176.1.p1  ORF type:complete len:149 (-),score=49.84 EC685176.1:41-487(-)
MKPQIIRQSRSFRRLSSVSLAMLMFITLCYSFAWLLVELVVCIYKGFALPFTDVAFGFELVALFLFEGVVLLRYFLGNWGNRTESVWPLVWHLLLSIPLFVGAAYYLRLQVYVLVVDVVMNALMLLFLVVETASALVTMINFCRHLAG